MAQAVKVLTEDAERGIREMLTGGEETRGKLKRALQSEMLGVKRSVQDVAKRVVGTGYKNSAGDPREAWKAVRVNMWSKKGIGASIAIMEGKTVQTGNYNPKRKGTRGERSQSARTRQLNSYTGWSRAFVLRFLNSGTKGRYTGGRNKRSKGVVKVYTNGGSVAYRGKIKSNGWFEQSATKEVTSAAEKIGQRFVNTITEQFEKA